MQEMRMLTSLSTLTVLTISLLFNSLAFICVFFVFPLFFTSYCLYLIMIINDIVIILGNRSVNTSLLNLKGRVFHHNLSFPQTSTSVSITQCIVTHENDFLFPLYPVKNKFFLLFKMSYL